MNILVFNVGSSSLKFSLYEIEGGNGGTEGSKENRLADGVVERMGTSQARLRVSIAGGATEEQPIPAETPGQAAEHVIRRLCGTPDKAPSSPYVVDAVGCRVVHGGARFVTPTRVSAAALEEIRALSDLAPLHNPAAVAILETCRNLLPQVPAVAVFDTAFHATLPDIASTYALPWELSARLGLRRYGFHGISHRYVSGQLLRCLNRGATGTRLITCHLGNGSSLCAVRDGRSVDTSMGMTPMEGLVMGTRSGDVDPGLVLYLLAQAGMAPKDVEQTLDRQSGLYGLSGRSGDVRDLEKAASQGDARAEMALEIFAYRACKYIGAYAAALEGLDAIAFTGGIGEHSPGVRSRICRRLRFLGLHVDATGNQTVVDADAPVRISKDDAPVQVWVIPSEEDLQIAREIAALLSSPAEED